MVQIEDFSRVVSEVHAASGRTDRWDQVFGEITRCLSATACTLVLDSDTERSLLATTIAPEAANEYENYYHQMDFVVDACESSPVGVVRSGWDLVADNKRTEFYHDWQRRFEMEDGLLVRLNKSSATCFVVSAPPSDQPYATIARVRFVNALIPHLQQALQTRHGLLDSDRRAVDISAFADTIRHGVVIIGNGGHVVTVNPAAKRIFAAQDGLSLHGNVLQTSRKSIDDVLQAKVLRAVGAHGESSRAGGDLICGRPSGKRSYILRTVPLDTDDDPAAARVAILIIDPEQEVKPSKNLLRQLFGLTAAETAVALRLLDGDDVKTVAQDLALSVATVRTHLLRLFRKTGTNRQAELVRVLTAIAA